MLKYCGKFRSWNDWFVWSSWQVCSALFFFGLRILLTGQNCEFVRHQYAGLLWLLEPPHMCWVEQCFALYDWYRTEPMGSRRGSELCNFRFCLSCHWSWNFELTLARCSMIKIRRPSWSWCFLLPTRGLCFVIFFWTSNGISWFVCKCRLGTRLSHLFYVLSDCTVHNWTTFSLVHV